MKNQFTIDGEIDYGFSNHKEVKLRVELWDRSLTSDEYLQSTTVDDHGFFRFELTCLSLNFQKETASQELFFKVYDRNTLLSNTYLTNYLSINSECEEYNSIIIELENPTQVLNGSMEPLIDIEELCRFRFQLFSSLQFQRKQNLSQLIRSIKFPFERNPSIMCLVSGALDDDPICKHELREVIWSYGGRHVPTPLGIKLLQGVQVDDIVKTSKRLVAWNTKFLKEHRTSNNTFSSSQNIVSLNALERLMMATAYIARDSKELATLASSFQLALAPMNSINHLFDKVRNKESCFNLGEAFDTSLKVMSFSIDPPFETPSPGDSGFPFPFFRPRINDPWFEWPMPVPFPTSPTVPYPSIPNFEPGLAEHFENCFTTTVIPELHRIGIGFREFIYGSGTNYIINSVEPENACPGDLITLRGIRFSGTQYVRYKNKDGRTVSSVPLSSSDSTITFELDPNAVSGPVWLYIPRTVRLCLMEHTVALPGVSGTLQLAIPHILEFRTPSTCISQEGSIEINWRVSPADTTVTIAVSVMGVRTELGTGLSPVGRLSYSPTRNGLHHFTIVAKSDPSSSCDTATDNLDVQVKTSPPTFEIVGVEITQAIQYFDLTNPMDPKNNSLELIANMDTVVRVFVRALSASHTLYSGSLTINGNSYPPMNNLSGILSASQNPLRSNTDDSLNFLIPASEANGLNNDAFIRLFNVGDFCVIPVKRRTESISWVEKSAFPITVRIIANSDGSQVSMADALVLVNKMLYRMPTPKTAISFHPGVHQIRRGTTEDNYCNDGGFYQLALSVSYEHNDNEGYPPASHSSSWLGILPVTGGCDLGGMMAWPSTSTCISVQQIGTMAHEVMHTVGLGHTITNNGEGCWEGPAFTGGAHTQPVPCHRLEGRPLGRLIEMPFDIVNNRVVASNSISGSIITEISNAFDLMSYRGSENNRWLSPELWVLGRTMMDSRY